MKSYLNQKNKPRGLRNNNPGNLVRTSIPWRGKLAISTDPKFEQFENLIYGIRAMAKDLINDVNKGKNTIRKIISEYAPPGENNTGSYIDFVSKKSGIGKDIVIRSLDQNIMLRLIRSILQMELGKSHTDVTDNDIKEALTSINSYKLNNVSYTNNANFFFRMKNFFIKYRDYVLIGASILITIGVTLVIKRFKK